MKDMAGTTDGTRTTAIAICLFVFLFACYMLAYRGQLHTIDEVVRLAVTESIARRGQFDINQIAWSQWALSPATRQGSFGLQGNVFSKKGIALSLLAVPLYRIALMTSQVGPVQTTMIFSPLITALTGVVVFLYTQRLGYSLNIGLATALAFGLSTIAWVYSKFFLDEPLSALTLFLAAYFLLRFRSKPHPIESALAGLSLGLAVATKTTNLAFVPIYVLYLILPCWQIENEQRGKIWKVWSARSCKPILLLVVPVIIVCLLLGLYNWVRFGNPLTTGYDFGAGETFYTPLWLGLYGFLFSPYKSIFLYSPILLACFVSLPLFFKRHRLESWLLGLIVIAHLLLFAKWYMWWGGFAWGPRFLVPLTPFLLITLAPLIEGVLAHRSLVGKLALAALALLSAAVQVLGVSVNFVLYEGKLREIFPAPEVNPALYDPPALYDFRYSPILGQVRLLSREYFDLAWLGPDWIDLSVLVFTLGLLLLSAVAIFQLAQQGNKALDGLFAIRHSPFAIVVIGLVSVVALSGFSLCRYYRDPSPGAPNAGYMQTLDHIEAHAQPSDGIVTITPYQYDFPMNHYRGRLPILGLAQAAPPLEDGMITLLEGTLSAHQRLWLVTAGFQPADPTNGVEEWLTQHAFKASDEWYGDFRLCLYGSPGEPSEPIPLDIQLGSNILLRGYQTDNQSVWPGQILNLSLDWQALEQPDRDYKVFAQLLSPKGQLVAQRDSQPLDGFRPTSTWRPDEEITDRYGLLLPDTLPPGAYQLVVGMYDNETGQRLQVSGEGIQAGADMILLREIEVSSSVGEL
jgi:hypothetical protein